MPGHFELFYHIKSQFLLEQHELLPNNWLTFTSTLFPTEPHTHIIDKMFSRSVVRAAGKATRSAHASRVATPTLATMSRNFSIGAKRDYEPINEKEIPRSTYEPGSTVQRTTINVEEAKATPSEAPAANVEKVVPLSRANFDKMTPMMQKMTLMDKIVIITG